MQKIATFFWVSKVAKKRAKIQKEHKKERNIFLVIGQVAKKEHFSSFLTLKNNAKNNVAFFFRVKKECAFFLKNARSFKKNAKYCNVLLGFISRLKFQKNPKKNAVFFKRTQKNVAYRTQHSSVPNPVCIPPQSQAPQCASHLRVK